MPPIPVILDGQTERAGNPPSQAPLGLEKGPDSPAGPFSVFMALRASAHRCAAGDPSPSGLRSTARPRDPSPSGCTVHRVGAAAFFDLDRTLLRGASGPLINEALVAAGIAPERRLPFQGALYSFYEAVGETLPSIALARGAALLARGDRKSVV